MIDMALSGRCWLCTRCKARSASRAKLAASRCGDSGTRRRDTTALVDQPPEVGRRHVLVETGTVQWCDTCGAYSESRTSRRMMNVCPGPPPLSAGRGGMRQQLMALKAGRHPVTGLMLPAPSRNMAALGSGTYARLKPTPNAGDEGPFVPYEPRVVMVPVPLGGSAERKRWLMRGRLRCKIGKEAALLRRRHQERSS